MHSTGFCSGPFWNHSGLNSGMAQFHWNNWSPEWQFWQGSLPKMIPPDSTGFRQESQGHDKYLHCHDSNEGQGRGQLGFEIQHVLSLQYVFFFLFQNFNSFFFTKCLSFKRSMNDHYHHHQRNDCDVETHLCLEFWYVIFFLSFFFLY